MSTKLTEALSEMLTVCQERDALADQVAELSAELEEQKSSNRESQDEIDRIDQVVNDLFNTCQQSPAPVGPLVQASISVLEAAKVLLQQCEKRLK